MLFGCEFSNEDVLNARATNGLLTMEIEVGTLCNFQCRYCYVGDGAVSAASGNQELKLEEIKDVVAQAQSLGARKIVLLGGEPMLYAFTFDLCEWMRARGLAVELFTNGSNMTAAMASRLYALGVHVVLKWHSSDASVQDWLAGVEGASVIMSDAYTNLRAAGYPSASARLALSTVICRQNIRELPELWRWIRSEGMEPYFEMLTPQGRARQNEDALAPSVEETHALFETICKIDREQFNRVWDAQPPLVGNACLRHSFSCLVTASGVVMPCVGVQLPVGNVRLQSLAKILADSEVITDLRDHARTIQGACGCCEKAEVCYGCRGAAFQMTGNYLGSDPLCWRNQKRSDLGMLPIAAERLVPHHPPVRMVDALTEVGERTATVTAQIRADNPHCRGGRLSEAAHLELMAQAAAALHGYRHQVRPDGAPQRGMLVGARDLMIHAPARVGDALTIKLHKLARLGTFGVVEAEVWRGTSMISKAELKTWYEA